MTSFCIEGIASISRIRETWTTEEASRVSRNIVYTGMPLGDIDARLSHAPLSATRSLPRGTFLRVLSLIYVFPISIFADVYSYGDQCTGWSILKWRGAPVTLELRQVFLGRPDAVSQSECHWTCLPGPYPFAAINMEFRARSLCHVADRGRPVPRPETTEFSRSRIHHAHHAAIDYSFYEWRLL